MSVYLLVAFIVAIGSTAGAGLILLDRYLEERRDKRLSRIVCDDLIPTAEYALEVYTKELMESIKDMTEEMMKMINDD